MKSRGQTTLPPMGNAENVELLAWGRAVCPRFFSSLLEPVLTDEF